MWHDSGMVQESDDEDMTDEQMFKMDKLLAAVLRIKKDTKDKAKNTKQVRYFTSLGLTHLSLFWALIVGTSWPAQISIATLLSDSRSLAYPHQTDGAICW